MAEHGKITQHAVWEFCADRVVNGRVVIIGDAAHMASPRTGAGAYTGLLDAHGLGVAFDRHGDVDAAVAPLRDDRAITHVANSKPKGPGRRGTAKRGSAKLKKWTPDGRWQFVNHQYCKTCNNIVKHVPDDCPLKPGNEAINAEMEAKRVRRKGKRPRQGGNKRANEGSRQQG